MLWQLSILLLLVFYLYFFLNLEIKLKFQFYLSRQKIELKTYYFGIAIGTFFSHGIAILFGSSLTYFENDNFQFILEVFTYFSFLIFGILGFIPKKEKNIDDSKDTFLNKISRLKTNGILVVALSIIMGELGDKTFLASIGLGVKYPEYKISLILGSICGMVLSNSIALFFGRFLGNKLNPKFVDILSNIIFLIFGIIGLFAMIF